MADLGLDFFFCSFSDNVRIRGRVGCLPGDASRAERQDGRAAHPSPLALQREAAAVHDRRRRQALCNTRN